MNVSEAEGPRRRRRPVVRCRVRLNEYMHETVAEGGGGIELAMREFMNKEKWRLFCRGHPLGRSYQRE